MPHSKTVPCLLDILDGSSKALKLIDQLCACWLILCGLNSVFSLIRFHLTSFSFGSSNFDWFTCGSHWSTPLALWSWRHRNHYRTFLTEFHCLKSCRHSSAVADDIIFHSNCLDRFLHLHPQLVKKSNLKTATGEEEHLSIILSLDALSKEIQSIDDLPLRIDSVRGISPAFCYSEVSRLNTVVDEGLWLAARTRCLRISITSRPPVTCFQNHRWRQAYAKFRVWFGAEICV